MATGYWKCVVPIFAPAPRADSLSFPICAKNLARAPQATPRSAAGLDRGPQRASLNAMSQFFRTTNRKGYLEAGAGGKTYVDYKRSDDLRRLMTPNGKIYSRKRTGISSGEQRKVARAIKRARYMALLPYTSATL